MSSCSFLIVLDIGSGSCKGGLAVLEGQRGDVTLAQGGGAMTTPSSSTSSLLRGDGSSRRTVRMLYEREVPSLLGHAVESSRSDGSSTIPDKAVSRLHDCMNTLFNEARAAFDQHALSATALRGALPPPSPSFDDLPRVGVCTAVFRETVNGPVVMHELCRRYRCTLRILDQTQEGVLGYLTGVAALAEMRRSGDALVRAAAERHFRGHSRLVVWDSGGASFQLTARASRTNGDSALLGCDSMVVFGGPWGSSKAVRAAITSIQTKPFDAGNASANPMSRAEVVATIDWIYQDLCEREKRLGAVTQQAATFRELLSSKPLDSSVGSSGDASGEAPPLLLGIGGETCAFRMAMLLLRKTRPEALPPQDHTRTHFRINGVALLEATLSPHVLHCSDAEFAASGFPQPDMVVPKLCLVLAVLKYFNVSDFLFVQTCGILQGLALTSVDESGQAEDAYLQPHATSRL